MFRFVHISLRTGIMLNDITSMFTSNNNMAECGFNAIPEKCNWIER